MGSLLTCAAGSEFAGWKPDVGGSLGCSRHIAKQSIYAFSAVLRLLVTVGNFDAGNAESEKLPNPLRGCLPNLQEESFAELWSPEHLRPFPRTSSDAHIETT